MINIMFGTPIRSMVSVVCWTLKWQYDPSDLGINMSCVGLSFVLNLFIVTVGGTLSTNTSSFVLKTGVWRMGFS